MDTGLPGTAIGTITKKSQSGVKNQGNVGFF